MKRVIVKLCLLAIICFISIGAFCQISEKNSVSSLKVGDKLPDIIFSNIMNYHDKNIKLADLKGKIIILDFWSTWCSSCIASFPKLEAIQKKYPDKLSILLVNTDEDISVVQNLLNKRKKILKKDLELPLIQDKILKKLFPHTGVPHIVWIDSSLIVKGITGMREMTSQNISDMIKGKNIELEQKVTPNDNGKDLSVQLLSNVHDELLGYSLLTKGGKDYPGEASFSTDNNGKSYITVLNASIVNLVKFAYREGGNEYPKSQFRLAVKDSSKYVSIINNKTAWENLYCYQMVAKKQQTFEGLLHIMKEDLKKYTDLDVRVIKRKMKCWVITAQDTNLIRSHSLTSSVIRNPLTVSLRKMPMFYLKNSLEYMAPNSDMPFIDSTNFNGNVDLEINTDITNPKLVNNELRRYKMALKEMEVIVDVLVISDALESKKPLITN